jgi:uncharacterized protein
MTYLLFIIAGCVSGILAGLLGIGGGSILVPTFLMLLKPNIDVTYISHISVATSTAIILFTSMFSGFSHFKYKTINNRAWVYMSYGVIAGSLLSTKLVFLRMSESWINILFTAFVTAISIQTIMKSNKVKHKDNNIIDKGNAYIKFSPNPWALIFAGFIIASISSIIGVGGGFLTLPLLLLLGMPIHNAVATSAALGLPIALTSTISYATHSVDVQNTLGLIYWPAVLIISPFSSAMAVIGAKITHLCDTNKLKRIYSYFLLVMCGLLLLRTIFSW